MKNVNNKHGLKCVNMMSPRSRRIQTVPGTTLHRGWPESFLLKSARLRDNWPPPFKKTFCKRAMLWIFFLVISTEIKASPPDELFDIWEKSQVAIYKWEWFDGKVSFKKYIKSYVMGQG